MFDVSIRQTPHDAHSESSDLTIHARNNSPFTDEQRALAAFGLAMGGGVIFAGCCCALTGAFVRRYLGHRQRRQRPHEPESGHNLESYHDEDEVSCPLADPQGECCSSQCTPDPDANPKYRSCLGRFKFPTGNRPSHNYIPLQTMDPDERARS